ncbi:hypothetical protein ACTQ3U_09245 [Oscillospiraceae bacterium LCP25S3_F9]
MARKFDLISQLYEDTSKEVMSPDKWAALNLCQYLGHKKLNFFSLHSVCRENDFLSC